MAKKRPTLDAFLNNQTKTASEETFESTNTLIATEAKKDIKSSKKISHPEVNSEQEKVKHEIFRYMLYLPLPVYDQLQSMVFEEQRGQIKRRKTHDYLLDAIDLLFKKKGLKSIKELTGEK